MVVGFDKSNFLGRAKCKTMSPSFPVEIFWLYDFLKSKIKGIFLLKIPNGTVAKSPSVICSIAIILIWIYAPTILPPFPKRQYSYLMRGQTLPGKFCYRSSRKYKIPWYPIYLEWAFYVENAGSSRNICRVFEKPINSHLQLYIILMSCSKCNFAKICRMKQFEIWGKSTNLWSLWYFHPIKCTFWI